MGKAVELRPAIEPTKRPVQCATWNLPSWLLFLVLGFGFGFAIGTRVVS